MLIRAGLFGSARMGLALNPRSLHDRRKAEKEIQDKVIVPIRDGVSLIRLK